MSEEKLNTLYLCYFGLREPLVQTQVVSYLKEIAKTEIIVNLLTFEPDLKEKWTDESIESEREKLKQAGIDWYFLPYHKRPTALATFYDVLCGAWLALKLVRRKKINVLHARTHIPLLMALAVKPFTGCKMIFDIRGLVAEEYVDAGIWRENSVPFRIVKQVERLGLKYSEQVVVLTRKAKDFLVSKNLRKADSIEVIPCCVDFSRIGLDETLEKRERFELIYAGSVTGLYLLSEMGRFFLELKKHKPDAFFRILTASSPEIVHRTFGELGISENDYAVMKVTPDEVPKYLKQAHLGISFRTPTFAQIAASPTKIPEYLACGLPFVSNYGIGDTDFLIETENVGVCLKDFSQAQTALAAHEIVRLLREKATTKYVTVARKYFDLQKVGGENYLKVYHRLY